MHFKRAIQISTALIIGLSSAFPVPSSLTNSTISARDVKGSNNDPTLPVSIEYGAPLPGVSNPIGHDGDYEIKALGEGICDYYEEEEEGEQQPEESKQGEDNKDKEKTEEASEPVKEEKDKSYDVINDNVELIDNELIDFEKVSKSLTFESVQNGTNLDINIGNPYPYKSTRDLVEEKYALVVNETTVSLINLDSNVRYLLGELSKLPVKTYKKLEREGVFDPEKYISKIKNKSKTLKTLVQRIVQDSKIKHEADVQRRKDRKERWKDRKAEYDSYDSTKEYIADKVTEKATGFAERHDLAFRTSPMYITMKIYNDGGRYARYTRNVLLHLISYKLSLAFSTTETTIDLLGRLISVL